MIRKGEWKEVSRVRKKLRKLLLKESMGFVVRSRHGQHLDSEKGSLYFMNRENKKHTKNSLQKLKIDNNVTSDKSIIEAAVLKYFGALFNGHHNKQGLDTGQPFVPDYTGLGDFLDGLGTLSQESQDNLIKPLDYEDIKNIVLHDCSTNKSPGLDGLSYEFYKTTWDIIGHDFQKVLQVQLQRLKLIDSDQHGATRLASKVDGVPGVEDLRPITLLNCDYKILTKAFVRRLCPVMVEIIKSGQLCSFEKKNILFGVMNILSSIDYVNLHKICAFMVSLDMFKAYDRVMLEYLVKVMATMKFPVLFIQRVQMLHASCQMERPTSTRRHSLCL